MRCLPRAIALALALLLFSALALTACGASQDDSTLPVSTATPVDPDPQTAPSPETTETPLMGGYYSDAMIMVSSDVLTVDEPLNIVGSGFLPGEPVMLVLVIDDIIRYVVGGRTAEQPVADAKGAFAVRYDSIRGPGGGERGALYRAPGVRTIRAEGDDGSRASFPVLITMSASGPGQSGSLSATAETVLDEETNSLDTTITAVGAGFMPGEAVTVTIVSLVDGADKVLPTGAANAAGAFTLSITLWGAPPAEGADPEMPIAPGVYTALAEGSGGSEATGPLVVEKKEPPQQEEDPG